MSNKVQRNKNRATSSKLSRHLVMTNMVRFGTGIMFKGRSIDPRELYR